MRKIIFDIETKNTFQQVGSNNVVDLDLSLIAIYDSVDDQYYSYLENELNRLWPKLEQADMLVGYNSDHFDIPLLNKYYPGDLHSLKSLDLLVEIRSALGRRIKLDSVAEGTLGIKKSGHGLQAIEWWQTGEIDKIRQYCIDDVRITKEVYDFARANNLLKYKEGGRKGEIKLNTDHWETVAGSTLTHTLPF